jgi:RNA polymerase sigma-70 factor (ECF subfamily)
VSNGDVQGLMDVLAPDVVIVADGGGIVPAAQRPVTGQKTVARLLAQLASAFSPGVDATTVVLNGAVAAHLDPGGEFNTAITFAIEDGRIARIYAIRNPRKLERLGEPAELRR